MTITLSALQKQRYDTAANWTAENPTLLAGEIGVESDTGKIKIGTGATAWTSLSYSGLIPGSGVYPYSQLLMPSGTAGAPSISFDGDVNTGIYRPGADQVAISTNGVQRINIEADGDINIDSGGVFYDATNNRLAIGTTSPGARLDVNGKLRLSSTEDNQLEWVSGAQTWRSNVVGGGKWYLYDVTNAKFPLDVSANTTCKLDINTSHVAFTTNNSERARIDSSGRLLVGTSTAFGQGLLQVNNSASIGSYFASPFSNAFYFVKSRSATAGQVTVVQSGDELGQVLFQGTDGTTNITAAGILAAVDGTPGTNDMPGRLVFSTTADGASSPTEQFRINNAGTAMFGTTDELPADNNVTGISFYRRTGLANFSRDGFPSVVVNRKTSDGDLVIFRQDGTSEGTISVSGTTVSYNGAHLSRWSQLPGGAERAEILRGTVLSNIDEMCGWGEEDNEQLNRMKVSEVEGDPNVAGVFQGWDDDDDTYTDDFYCAMTGDFIIRIAEGVTVQRGDLLMSAGDGTAKPQDDDIIRSKTVAKVTSTHVTCTYDDGSYCVPCVLMAC